MRLPATFSRPLFIAAVTFAVLITAPVAATIGIYWEKNDVVPVVMVRPSISGFVPVDGTPIGNTWTKDEVTPMCLVRPSVGGFVPATGSPIGNSWSKNEVKPFVEVEPSIAGFQPKETSDTLAPAAKLDTSPSPYSTRSCICRVRLRALDKEGIECRQARRTGGRFTLGNQPS